MTPLAAFAIAGCLSLGSGSDYIRVEDLAPGFPALAEVAPDITLAAAPVPGTQRVFHASELARLASRFHVEPVPESEICVERPTQPLDRWQILEAMRRQVPDARIELIDFSRQPVPRGSLEFPLTGLRQNAGGGYWYGLVPYGSNHRFAVWAKVRVLVAAPRVIAAADLKAGRPIDAGQLRLEVREEPPSADRMALAVEEVAGLAPRRAIASGTAIRLQWIEPPKDVRFGDTVKVEVVNGGAHLEFEGQAQASGSTGQMIPVLNPVSKKRFPARVEGKGRVSVKGTP